MSSTHEKVGERRVVFRKIMKLNKKTESDQSWQIQLEDDNLDDSSP